jgi:hypothetical protein
MCGYYVVLGAAPIAFYVILLTFGPGSNQRALLEHSGFQYPEPRILQYMGALTFTALCLGAAVQLFKLHKSSVWFLGAIIFLSALNRFIQFRELGALVMEDNLSSIFLELGVEVLMFLNALRLRQQGVLS